MKDRSSLRKNEELARQLRNEVRERYEADVDQTHRSLLLAWLAFAVTFGVTRAITAGIKHEVIPNVNVASDGLHIHHYVWGIALLLIVGYVALVDDKARFHKYIALAYGAGAALIIDEFALLLNLRDVYWADEGRWSVDIALGIIVVIGLYVTAARFWNDAVRVVARFARRPFRGGRRKK